jgi:hypothetical protein
MAYVLHSEECLAAYSDLRECPYSIALDKGVDTSQWTEDLPVPLRIDEEGWLADARRETADTNREAAGNC